MPEAVSAVGVQQALEFAAPGWWETGLAVWRQQGMLQFSAPAQAGVTAAARINSARARWMHWVTIDFIRNYYRIMADICQQEKQVHGTSSETKSNKSS
jgi:hypothetical protein